MNDEKFARMIAHLKRKTKQLWFEYGELSLYASGFDRCVQLAEEFAEELEREEPTTEEKVEK